MYSHKWYATKLIAIVHKHAVVYYEYVTLNGLLFEPPHFSYMYILLYEKAIANSQPYYVMIAI